LLYSSALAQVLIQPGGEVIAAEGDSLTLNCTFETTFTPHLFWYRREKNGNINYILRHTFLFWLFPSGVSTANKSHGKLGNVLRRMPFLMQPSQSNWALDWHRSREGNREQPGFEPWFHGRKAPQTSTS
uniref:Ig-like domain-containing protein n=1 Tax=Oryzias latipes TaxID=8090 RepID=A0A3P9HV47_ORYLA